MKKCYLLISIYLITAQLLPAQTNESSPEQLWYDKVVRLKDGTVLRNIEVTYETESGKYERYSIKDRNGSFITKLPSDVQLIESHSRTFLPPRYYPIDIVYPCDDRQREQQWYFAEIKGWVMFTDEDKSENAIGQNQFTFGPEIALGWRSHPFGAGVGVAYFTTGDINRFPVFLHLRYQMSARCFAPYFYSQLGTVFDNQSGAYLAFDKIFSPAPKFFSVGIGIDYPIASWLDWSVDLGYRYLQLPTKVPCDCSDQLPLNEAVYYNESHSIVLRMGVTF